MTAKPPPRRPQRSSMFERTFERLARGAKIIVRRLDGHNAFEAAASIAFWFFLSLVPLLVLGGFLIGQVARARGIDELIGPLLDVVPSTAEGLVQKELGRVAGSGTASVAPLGIAGFLWTASSGLHNLMDVIESSVNAKRQAWWKQRAIALGWVLFGLAVVCALAWVIVKTDAVMQSHDSAVPAGSAPSASASSTPPLPPPAVSARPTADRSPNHAQPIAHVRGTLQRRVHRALNTPREQVFAGSLLLVVGASLLAGFYRFAVQHPPGVRRRVWPGTITAVLSWLVVSWAFGEYAASLANYALYYGSLAAVAVLLVWLYLTSLVLVVGAEVNAQLEGVRGKAEAAR